jgi:hypothetical protein
MSEPNGVTPDPALDLEAPEADVAEQHTTVRGELDLEPRAEPGPTADLEAPEADAADQHTPVGEQEDPLWPDTVPLDANEADVAEQSRVVEMDEDDYR